MITYILHSSILLCGFFIFYWLLLRNETFYKLNRWLLLAMIGIAMLLPLITIPQSWSLSGSSVSNQIGRLIEIPSGLEIENKQTHKNTNTKKNTEKNIPQNDNSFSIANILLTIYFVGIIVFTVTFLIQIFLLLQNKKNLETIQDGKYTIYELVDDTPPFSFLRSIFINPSLYKPETFEQILRHEKVHISQAHFIDKFIAEMGVILFWFNPFMWGLRTAISNNLEFLTDEEMLKIGVDPESYQLSLLEVSAPKHPLNATTSYNQSILKKRIKMMKSKKSSARSSWKYIAIIPLLILSILSLNTSYYSANESKEKKATKVKNKKEFKETINKNILFSDDSSENLFMLGNVTGAIEVKGYEGDSIQITAKKIINADDDDELQRGIKETNIKVIEQGSRVYVYLDSPYSKFDSEIGNFTYRNDCNKKSCFKYKFQLHYQVKVPFNTNLRLRNVNGGDILVENVQANEIDVIHISGGIKLKNVAGATEARTISGGIEATYQKNPNGESKYVTVSGNIKVDFLQDLNAIVNYKAKDGRMITEFDVVNPEKSLDKYSGRIKSPFVIGSGETTLNFETVSGNIYLNKK